MAVVSKAIVRDSDGLVLNVCAIEESKTEWPNAGESLVDYAVNCETGATYKDGAFTRAPARQVTRTEVLMGECMTTKKIDRDNGTEENDYLVDKTSDEIVAEKRELAQLLKAAHADNDLSIEGLNMRVRLNIDGY